MERSSNAGGPGPHDSPRDRQTLFADLQQRLVELLRASPAADLERNVKALLSQTFTRLELVSREEFDIQREILAGTRDKLNALEKRLAELEHKQRAR
jgi:ubiquinone biosynthesis accessory factor UbiK